VTGAVRRLGPDDLEAYRAIRLEALTNHPEAFVSSAESFAAKGDDDVRRMLEELAVFGFEDGEGLGGLVAFLRSDGLKDRHRGWMIQVYVRPRLRGQGVGQRLVEHLLDHARHHVLQVHLGVWSENVPAIRLYERLGFKVYGTEPRYLFVNGRFIDEHLMVRFLDEAPGKSQE